MRENLIDASRDRTVYLTDFMRVVVVLRGATFTPGGEGRIVYLTCIQRMADVGTNLRSGQICSCVEQLALLQEMTEVGDQLARVVDFEVVEEAEEIQEIASLSEVLSEVRPVPESAQPARIGHPVAAANAAQPEADPTRYGIDRYYDAAVCIGCGRRFTATNAVTIVSFDPEDRSWDITVGHLSPDDGLLTSGLMDAIDAIRNGQVRSVHCSFCGLCFEEFRLNEPRNHDEAAAPDPFENLVDTVYTAIMATSEAQDSFGNADGTADESVVGRRPCCRLESCASCGHSLRGNGRILVKITGRDRRYAGHLMGLAGMLCLEHSQQSASSLQETILNRFQYAQCGGCNERLPIYYATQVGQPTSEPAPAPPPPAPVKEPPEVLRPLEFDDEP